jgi:hypothetical protein
MKLAQSVTLSQLAYIDFFALLDGAHLVKFNNKGLNNRRLELHQELTDKILKLGDPPYYYTAVVKAYLQRFDTICDENLSLR